MSELDDSYYVYGEALKQWAEVLAGYRKSWNDLVTVAADIHPVDPSLVARMQTISDRWAALAQHSQAWYPTFRRVAEQMIKEVEGVDHPVHKNRRADVEAAVRDA